MPRDPRITRPRRQRWQLSSETLSNTRLALVTSTLIATVVVLLAVFVKAHEARDALDEASAHTLRDYSGYASRLLGSDVLRRFSEQRATILAPVIGRSGHDVPAPALEDIARVGHESFAQLGALGDTALGYYRIDVATRRIDGLDGVKGVFARRIVDTVSALIPGFTPATPPGIAALQWDHVSYSIVFAPFFDAHQKLVAVYGFAYTRGLVVSAVASTVFREVPLLPVSFAGARWNYDTTRVRVGEVINDSLIAMRVTERGGRLLWQTRDAGSVIAATPYGARSVLSTRAGGIVVEAAMRQAAEPSLVPNIVTGAQRWTLRSLMGLALLLVMVSLIALRGERQGVRARRVEAMQQLALGLRHEINNALASMLLNAELLNEERTLTADQHDRLDAIVEQAERMRSVVRRLEQADKLDVLVPYLNEGLMVDLSTTRERDAASEFGRVARA